MKTVEQNIPHLRFPQFDGKWLCNRLEDIATFSKGKGISKEDISDSGSINCIRYGELYTIYGEVIKELVLSEANDVIIPSSGESHIDIATASCVVKAGIALGGDLNIIKSKLDGVYLSYYLNNSKKIDIARLSQGISVVHLYPSQLKTLKLFYPSLPEQQKIASFLTAVDNKIQLLTKKKELLEQYKKGVMQKIFKQEIRFSDEDGKEFSEWEKTKLGDILIEINEKSSITNQYEVLSSTKEGIFKQIEYFNREIASKDNKGYKILRKNQLVFSPQNLWLGNINLNTQYEIGIVSPSYKIFKIMDYISTSYIKNLIKTPKID